MSNRHRNQAFTLIEILTVIMIIGLLMSLLFPAINGAMKKAKTANARAEVKSIEQAVKSYMSEYGKLPVQNSLQGDTSESGKRFGYDTPASSYGNDKIMNTLRAISVASDPNLNHALNPKRIVFLEAKTTTSTTKAGVGSDGVFRDPWAQPYIIVLDLNYNNETDCSSTYGIQSATTVAVISTGADKTLGNSDDVLSFR